MKKIALQIGLATPGQVGIELEPKKPGEKTLLEAQPKPASPQSAPNKKGVPGQGRPVNSKDSKQRKKKQFNPKSRASIELWADDAQDKIAAILVPIAIANFGYKSIR